MENIRQAAQKFIDGTDAARFAVVEGEPGVIFLNPGVIFLDYGAIFVQDGSVCTGKFIPFNDLGYNADHGFFCLSALPGVRSDYTNENPWMLHPVDAEHEDWSGFAIVDDGEHAFLIGEEWQLYDMLKALQDGISNGRLGERLFDNDEIFGVRYLSIAEACVEAHKYNPQKYPFTTANDKLRLRARLQRNIQRGKLWGVRRDPQGHYRIRETAFRGWLASRE